MALSMKCTRCLIKAVALKPCMGAARIWSADRVCAFRSDGASLPNLVPLALHLNEIRRLVHTACSYSGCSINSALPREIAHRVQRVLPHHPCRNISRRSRYPSSPANAAIAAPTAASLRLSRR